MQLMNQEPHSFNLHEWTAMHPFSRRNTDSCHVKILNYKKFKMQNQKHTNKIFQHLQLSVVAYVVLVELLKIRMQYENKHRYSDHNRIQKPTNNCLFQQMIIN